MNVVVETYLTNYLTANNVISVTCKILMN